MSDIVDDVRARIKRAMALPPNMIGKSLVKAPTRAPDVGVFSRGAKPAGFA